MIVINKSGNTKYSTLAHRDIGAGAKSADIDAAGLCQAIETVVNACGNSFYLRLNPKERALLSRLMTLDDEGREYKVVSKPKVNPFTELLKRDAEEKRQKMAAIKQEREKEASIKAETTYTSRQDMDEARAKASNIKGEVVAKKLGDQTTVSLKDLMGDNKFIEESMKHSNIKTAVASEEGWDMDKLNAPKVSDTAEQPKPASEAAKEPATPVKPAKTSTGAKSQKKKASK